MKNLKFIFLALLMAIVMIGCSSGQEESADSNSGGNDKKYEIAGILMQSDVEWFKQVELGMYDAAVEYGANLTIGNSDLDITEEANLIDTYASQGKDAIVVSAIDESASAEAIKRAQEKGVLVVNYNTHVDESVEEYFVGIDNYELGYQAGEELVKYVNEHLDGKAKVAMVTLSMFGVGQERADGFLAAIENEPGIEVVAQQDASGPEEGADVTETMLQGNPDIDLIWAANEGGAVGAVIGVQSKGLDDKIKVFGTDMSMQSAQYLLDDSNPYYAVSTQQPYEIGYESVRVAVEVLEGKEVEKETIVPLDMYLKTDKEKIEQYIQDVKDL